MNSGPTMPDSSERLSGGELERMLTGKTVRGSYLGGFQFVTHLRADGSMEGENHFGVRDAGNWTVDTDNDTFSVRWNGGWVNTTTYAYSVDGEIRFHDVATSEWRNTFTKIE